MFLTPWVTRLLAVNVVAYLVVSPGTALHRSLAFVPSVGTLVSTPWTVLTYMFLHAGIWHLAFNMIGLVFFGPRLEARLGARRFLILYFLGGFGGAAFSLLFDASTMISIVGASAAVFAVLLAFAYYWPREVVLIWGVLPMQVWALVTLLIVVSLWSGFTGAGGNVAHFAHLGGLAFGFGYLRWLDWKRAVRISKANARPAPGPFGMTGAGERDRVSRWKRIDPQGLHSLNRREVEELLEKLDAGGASSLTNDEKAFLDRMAP